jgi:hypothetical protein
MPSSELFMKVLAAALPSGGGELKSQSFLVLFFKKEPLFLF